MASWHAESPPPLEVPPDDDPDPADIADIDALLDIDPLLANELDLGDVDDAMWWDDQVGAEGLLAAAPPDKVPPLPAPLPTPRSMIELYDAVCLAAIEPQEQDGDGDGEGNDEGVCGGGKEDADRDAAGTWAPKIDGNADEGAGEEAECEFAYPMGVAVPSMSVLPDGRHINLAPRRRRQKKKRRTARGLGFVDGDDTDGEAGGEDDGGDADEEGAPLAAAPVQQKKAARRRSRRGGANRVGVADVEGLRPSRDHLPLPPRLPRKMLEDAMRWSRNMVAGLACIEREREPAVRAKLRPSPLDVVMIVVVCDVSGPNILDALGGGASQLAFTNHAAQRMEEADVRAFVREQLGEGRELRLVNDDSFRNATIIGFDEPPSVCNKHWKYFNGVLHVCGVRCMDEFLRLAHFALRLLHVLLRRPPDAGEWRPTGFRVAMINTVFSIGHHLLLSNAHAKPRSVHGVLVASGMEQNTVYDPDVRHDSAVQVAYVAKSGRKVFVRIFASGKIIMTGGTEGRGIEEAYAFVTRLLHDNIDIVRAPPRAAASKGGGGGGRAAGKR